MYRAPCRSIIDAMDARSGTKSLCAFFLAICSTVTVAAQGVISTFAGTDGTFTGDGLPAVNAGLGLITGIAVDQSGNVYINDPDNHLVFRVGTDGVIHVVAGNGIGGDTGDNGPASSASIGGDETPYDLQRALPKLNGIAVDAGGNIFIASGLLVRRIDATGTITTYAGGGSNQPGDGGLATQAALGLVLGVAVDTQGDLYFVDHTYATVRKVAANGIITTVAGTGSSGFSGDGGPATKAQLNNPSGIACDSQGNVYVAESFPSHIRKITVATGIIDSVAGGGTEAPGPGVPPLQVAIGPTTAVAVDNAGNIYTYAPLNGAFIKFAPNGDSSYVSSPVGGSTSFFATGIPASQLFISGSSFSNSGLAVDAAGNLYASLNFRGLVRKIDTGGIVRAVAGNNEYRFSPNGTPAISAELRNPVYLAVGADGSSIFFHSADGLREIGANELLGTVTQTPPFQNPALIGLTIDPSGNFYTAFGSSIVRLASSGAVSTIVGVSNQPGSGGDNGPAGAAQLNKPMGLAADKSGNLFIADTGNNKIRKVGPNNVITTIAGTGQSGHTGDGGSALSATFSALGAMLADNQGGVYVIDGNYIRHVLANGSIEAVAGNGTAGFSGDGGPAVNAAISVEYRSGLALDSAGNLYFSDSDVSNHVRRIAPDNTITTVAGTGTQGGFAGDGGPATNALLSQPLGLALDAMGNLYIADSGNNRIRVILASAPSISADVTGFTFVGSAGGAAPPTQYVTITGSVDNIPFTVAQTPNTDWLSLSVSSGVTPRVIQVTADPSQLRPQNYQATLTVQTPNATPSAIPISISFQVGAGNPAQLVVDKQRLSFTYPLSAPSIVEIIKAMNAGSGSIAVNASAQTTTGGNWLSVTPASGTVTPSQILPLVVRAVPTGLQPGTYHGTVTVSSTKPSGQSVIVPVTMTVSSATQAILLSHAGLTFTAVQHGGIVPPQFFAVDNLGIGIMNWTATTTTFSGGQQWLSATPATGASTAGSAPPKVRVAVHSGGLAPGHYYGLVRITAPGAANTPHVITVVLRVLPSSTDLDAAITPAELFFTTTAGADPPSSQSLFIYNITATPKTFTSSGTLAGTSLNYLPQQATLTLDASTEIVVQPITTGFAPGVYRGNLTFQFSDGRTRDVRLHLLVKPASGGTAAGSHDETAHASTCTPTKLIPTLTSLGQSFNAPAGWPVALESNVLDDCGKPLVAGSVVVSFSNGDASLSLASLHDGEWQATWTPDNEQSSGMTVTVAAQSAQQNLQGSLQISGALLNTSDAPQISASGIVSGASFAAGVPLAPGTIVSVFGAQLADGKAGSASLPLAEALQGASLVIAGEPSPLFFVSSGQINAVVPLDITPNTSQQVLITRDTTLSVPVSIDMAPAQPAVFLDPQPNAPNQGTVFAVRNTATGATTFLAGPSSPATAGDTLVIYCAGLGDVNESVAPGAASPTSPPADTNAKPAVTVGGVPAPVAFSGLSPGLVGVYQINAVMPSGVAASDQASVVITIAGQTSPVATIAVK